MKKTKANSSKAHKDEDSYEEHEEEDGEEEKEDEEDRERKEKEIKEAAAKVTYVHGEITHPQGDPKQNKVLQKLPLSAAFSGFLPAFFSPTTPFLSFCNLGFVFLFFASLMCPSFFFFQIIVNCTDDSGKWPKKGLFAAISKLYLEPGKRFEEEKPQIGQLQLVKVASGPTLLSLLFLVEYDTVAFFLVYDAPLLLFLFLMLSFFLFSRSC